jgi:hypothetical protein
MHLEQDKLSISTSQRFVAEIQMVTCIFSTTLEPIVSKMTNSLRSLEKVMWFVCIYLSVGLHYKV